MEYRSEVCWVNPLKGPPTDKAILQKRIMRRYSLLKGADLMKSSEAHNSRFQIHIGSYQLCNTMAFPLETHKPRILFLSAHVFRTDSRDRLCEWTPCLKQSKHSGFHDARRQIFFILERVWGRRKTGSRWLLLLQAARVWLLSGVLYNHYKGILSKRHAYVKTRVSPELLSLLLLFQGNSILSSTPMAELAKHC